MITVLSTPDGDIHRATAASVLGIPVEQVTGEQRRLAKALNFGLLYGMGAPAFRKYAARPPYLVKLTIEKAIEHRDRFFRTYPALSRVATRAGPSRRKKPRLGCHHHARPPGYLCG